MKYCFNRRKRMTVINEKIGGRRRERGTDGETDRQTDTHRDGAGEGEKGKRTQGGGNE